MQKNQRAKQLENHQNDEIRIVRISLINCDDKADLYSSIFVDMNKDLLRQQQLFFIIGNEQFTITKKSSYTAWYEFTAHKQEFKRILEKLKTTPQSKLSIISHQ